MAKKYNIGDSLPSAEKLTDKLFTTQEQRADAKLQKVHEIDISKLVEFAGHPFRPYPEQRMLDFVQDIKDNGIILPIIVRPTDESSTETNYEILSGHNRYRAAKKAEFNSLPAIVKTGLTDAEALIIVTQSNLLQRGIADMTHSELALVLHVHNDAIKHQGKRNDLIQEIEMLVNASDINDSATYSPMGNKFTTMEQVGLKYDLSKNTVARYLRIYKLVEPLKEMLDDGKKLRIRAAVELSYLSNEEQYLVADALESFRGKLDIKKAEALRASAKKNSLNLKSVEEILEGKKESKPNRPTTIQLKPDVISKYFTPGAKQKEIMADVIEGLELLRAQRAQKGRDNP